MKPASAVISSTLASGLNNTFCLLGVAVGVAALGAIVEGKVTSSLTESLGATPPAGLVDVVATGNVEAAARGAPAELAPQTLDAARLAFVAGLDTILLVAALVAFAGAALALLLVRGSDMIAPAEEGAAVRAAVGPGLS